MSRKTVTYSDIQFRRSLADGDTIYLGTIFEFSTRDFWVVALSTRVDVAPETLDGVDELSRDVIKNISQIIKDDILRALPNAEEQGDVLATIAAQNSWSITVGSPSKIEVTVDRVSDTSTDDIAQSIMLFLTKKKQEPQLMRPALPRNRGRVVTDKISHLPPPWMLPPQCFQRAREDRC